MTEKVWRAYWEGRHAGREPRPHHCTTIRPSCTPEPMQGISSWFHKNYIYGRERGEDPTQSIAQLNQVAISDQRLHAGCLKLSSMGITHIAGVHRKFS